MAGVTESRAPGLPAYLVLLVVLTMPFWALDLFAGRIGDWFPENLPASALMVVVPAIAAAILIGRRDGRAGLGRWMRRVGDVARIRGAARWGVVLASMPAVYLSAWLVMRLLEVELPDFTASWSTVVALLALYFVAAAAEELGWTGYATDVLLPRCGVWATGAVLGVAWALWHLPGFINGGNDAWWVLWQCMSTVVFRMLIVRTYTWAKRSLFAATAMHALSNISWNLFPANGSGYDPLYTTVIMSAVVLATAVLGPRSRAEAVS